MTLASILSFAYVTALVAFSVYILRYLVIVLTIFLAYVGLLATLSLLSFDKLSGFNYPCFVWYCSKG